MPLTPYGDSGGDWLQSLLANYGAAQPYGPGAAGVGLAGHMPTAGLVAGYGSGPTPGAPSMGYPGMGQPQQQAANAAASQGPPQADQQSRMQWLMSIMPHLFGGGGDQPVLPYLNPGVGSAAAAPGPTPGAAMGMPSRPITPTPQNYPSWPTVGAQGSSPAAVMANAPPGNPSETPKPATPMPPRRPRNLGGTPAAPTAAPAGNPRFGLYQSQVPGMGQGPLSRNPIYTTLNLFGGRSS